MPLYPKPSIPDWADPAQASVMDPLYKTLARKAVGVLGLDDPASSAMSAATPMTAVESAPANLIQNLLKVKVGPNEQAAGGLIDHLLNFKQSKPNLKGLAAGNKVTRFLEPPLRYGSILTRMESRVPEAAGAFDIPAGKTVTRAPGLTTSYMKQAAMRNPSPSQETGLVTDMLKGRYDRPAIKSFDELKDIGPSLSKSLANEGSTVPKLTFYSNPQNGRSNVSSINALKRSNLTEDDVRLIRSMSNEDAIKQYPHLKPGTLTGIRRNDTFAWVK